MITISDVCTDSKLDGFPPYDERSMLRFFFYIDEVILWLLIGQVLLFFKYYDPSSTLITYMGHSVENISKRFGRCTV